MKQPVTLIGLGPMGRSMVHALLDAGHPVTVWNRTASRADDVVARGAVRAATPAEAVRAADLVVLSLTDYAAMYDILGRVEDLTGKVVVNLSSDSPEVTREAAKWAEQRGARFLTGGVMVPAPMIGTEASYVYYSGPKDLFDAHEKTLGIIGKAHHMGTDPGLAQLFYQANLDVFLTALSAFLHGSALLGSAGVPAKDFAPWAAQVLQLVIHFLPQAAEQVDSDNHPGDLSTVTMMGATADHVLAASEEAGVDLDLPRAIKAHYDRAIAAGKGGDNWTRLIDGIRNPA
ncbi:3-hydroxyisobutyrate dehydrogenase [Saccharopolyspora antimicrobica]|uniref:3-hydroxyisobutyrate dehydrogenase n=1 Tax=Saccharopolyspora antimicrobica TaxID=455193 RepID=A0A1I5ECE9_9PSEU|nr:NAD(P)-binding domain-containing protein [Saccharopolyspora antimicrobica]RKT86763.1 3-hydroxyisobutyrate dehydrogenase-like beta-hydroxyacid dehydrogenase [Saccharopolyspora antimicrobica]SFO09167.1 3-hydroxyisobutyrate dehydrogenase [Saccharopolyspora antimicrobica]